jgi:hypothetical protein
VNGWIRQKHNSLIDSFRVCRILNEGDRVVCLCPDTNNELINCSREFFDTQVESGNILVEKHHD